MFNYAAMSSANLFVSLLFFYFCSLLDFFSFHFPQSILRWLTKLLKFLRHHKFTGHFWYAFHKRHDHNFTNPKERNTAFPVWHSSHLQCILVHSQLTTTITQTWWTDNMLAVHCARWSDFVAYRHCVILSRYITAQRCHTVSQRLRLRSSTPI